MVQRCTQVKRRFARLMGACEDSRDSHTLSGFNLVTETYKVVYHAPVGLFGLEGAVTFNLPIPTPTQVMTPLIPKLSSPK